jgi:hypothetical protein
LAIRIICYGLGVLQVLMLILSGVIVVISMGPEPGANMTLMALVLLAMPMSAVSLLLLLVPLFAYRYFGPRERWVFAGLGSCFLLVFGALWLLG